MFQLIRHPFISVPMKFIARVCMGSLCGIAFSPFELDVKVWFGAIMTGLAVLMMYLPIRAWDRSPMDGIRMALYGLVIVGEALCVGAVVLGAFGAFQGHLQPLPMMLIGFAGILSTLFGMAELSRSNIKDRPGSKP